MLSTFDYCVEQLKDFYKEKLWMGTYVNPPPQSGDSQFPDLYDEAEKVNSCGKPPQKAEAITALELKLLYNQGATFIESNKNNGQGICFVRRES